MHLIGLGHKIGKIRDPNKQKQENIDDAKTSPKLNT